MNSLKEIVTAWGIAVCVGVTACGALASERQPSVPPMSREASIALFSRSLNRPNVLEDLVDFPFRFETTNERKTCETVIASATGIRKLTLCLDASWKLLLENLGERPVEGLKQTALKDLPSFAAARFKDDKGLWFFVAWCNGDGVTYQLVFEGRKDSSRISRVLIDQEFVE